MNLVLRHKFEILLLSGLILFYFILRLPNLTLQPIFADEAIYIRWAQVMKSEPTLRFLPISDGKTPLYMWTLMPILKVIPDPLFAGRFLSVLTGFVTLVGVYVLARKVFGAKTAFWAGLLYVITPYAVFFDRMALVDSMLAAFTVWIIYFAICLVKNGRFDIAMILGYLLGGAILAKTPGMINLLILPISFLGFRRGKNYSILKLLIFWAVAICIGLVIYNLLRLGPQFHMLSSRNADYVFSPLELVGRPLDPFIPHMRDISDWFPKLFTWPILFCVVVGISYTVIKVHRLGLIVLLWALIPFLIESAFLKTFTARYLLSSIAPLLIIGGYGIVNMLPKFSILNRFSYLLMGMVILPLALYFNFLLLTDPQKAPLPKAERIGYFEDWTAGYNFSEIASFLKEKRKTKKVVVGTEGFFGTLPDGLQIYLDKDDIAIIGGKAEITEQLRNSAKDNLTYFVGNKLRMATSVNRMNLIKEYPKAKPLGGGEQDAIVLYEVLP